MADFLNVLPSVREDLKSTTTFTRSEFHQHRRCMTISCSLSARRTSLQPSIGIHCCCRRQRDALKGAWGENALGEMNQVEIIDIRDETALRSSWREFIRFDHYEVHSCFYESWIADNSPNPQLPTCSQEIPQQNTGCTIPWDEESRHGIKQSHRSLQAATLICCYIGIHPRTTPSTRRPGRWRRCGPPSAAPDRRW